MSTFTDSDEILVIKTTDKLLLKNQKADGHDDADLDEEEGKHEHEFLEVCESIDLEESALDLSARDVLALKTLYSKGWGCSKCYYPKYTEDDNDYSDVIALIDDH